MSGECADNNSRDQSNGKTGRHSAEDNNAVGGDKQLTNWDGERA